MRVLFARHSLCCGVLRAGLLFATALSSAGSMVSAAEPPSASASSALAPDWRDVEGLEAAQRLRRGINFGNALEAPPGTWGDRRYGPEDFRAVREAGFDHVRIPVAWHHHTGPAPAYLVAPDFFSAIDALVEAGRRERLTLILNWHHFDRMTAAPDDTAVAWWHVVWRQIARHYRSVPPTALYFELINEPRDQLTNERLNVLYPPLIRAIREEDSRRTLLVSPGDWGALREVPALRLPRDLRNIIVTGHCYEPFLFTHQGASWTGAMTRTTGLVFPGPPAHPVEAAAGVPDWVRGWIRDYNQMETKVNPCGSAAFTSIISDAADWGRREGRAIHVGEFGAIRTADASSRAAYAAAMRSELDRHGLGWAWWDWKAAFAVSGQTARGLEMEPGIRGALLPAQPIPGAGLEVETMTSRHLREDRGPRVR